MTTNYIKLESGHEYTLKQLFNGKNRIVIPDLQRDYCWGDKAWNKEGNNYTELVSAFLGSLTSFFSEKPKEKLTLGLIYGYENPHFHIQLCDGQQRLTTLFLLMGMINRKTENNQFKDLLISEEELADDKEPNLQYAIRESTLYFLSDLVCYFFLNNEVKIENIRSESWYFKHYDLDASIQSMISAIKLIDTKLTDIDYENFGDFIVDNLQMLYYDMGHRTRGEETFVIINTTGEPLTATENLKPILIGNIKDEQEKLKVSKEWEDREEWFWQNRKSDEKTSDKGLNDFFIWYWQIRLLQEKSWKDKKSYPHNPNELFQKKPLVIEGEEENPDIDKWEESKSLDTVHKYFTALAKLVDRCKTDAKILEVLKTIQKGDISLSWFRAISLDVVLPLVAYIEKFTEPQNLYQFIRRIRKNFFDNKWTERKENFVDWRYIVQIIGFSESELEVLEFENRNYSERFKKIANVPLNEWYNDEEKTKKNFILRKTEIEMWEDHQDFMGDLSFLISVNQSQNAANTFEALQKYYNNYVNIIDIIRVKKDSAITNTYRLFLLYIGCEKVEHKYRISWKIEGVLFSTISRKHLFNDEFKKLCFQEENNLEVYCLAYINKKIKEWDLFNLSETNFNTDKALKCWLTLKVFYANKEKRCLAYYDGGNSEEGVSVYKSANSNKLIDSELFSIYNMICGFGVKAGGGGSYVHYTIPELWLKTNIIDSPFAEVSFGKDDRTKEQLEGNKKVIDEILNNVK